MEKQIEDNARLSSPTIYEIISREGDEELKRPLSSLAWSGFAAGLCISFSLLAEAYFRLGLGDSYNEGAGFLIQNIGYTFGFLIVVTSRLQLFTENTITPILPMFERQTWRSTKKTLRLWAVVFAANMAGTFFVALSIYKVGVIREDQYEALVDISLHAVNHPMLDIFILGIPAGFLMAAMVWMLPSARQSKIFVIFLMSYLIAIGDFSHVVAGSTEAFLVMLTGDISIIAALGYILAAGMGNIIGGSGLFALLAYAQVRDEI